MAITYKEVVTFGTELVAAIKQAILTSSDWSHLQLTTGTQATTLASAAAAAAVSISTTATIPSGSYIVIGNGAANPEVRVTTGVSGSGPYTVTFAKALEASYGSGSAVGVGTYVKATTTRGAQMVIDFAEAVHTTSQMSLAMYRTHNGTTGVDKILRFLQYNVGSLTTNPMRVKVSASKEHLYVEVEGPRAGETGSDATAGPYRKYIYMGDITPYFAGDTVPAVICIAQDLSGGTIGSGTRPAISRNQGDTDSWVPSSLLSMSPPFTTSSSATVFQGSWQQLAKGDGKIYIFPYLILEDRDGLRGRVANLFFAGWSQNNNVNPQSLGVIPFVLNEGSFVSYGGTTYRVFKPVHSGSSPMHAMALAQTQSDTANDISPLIALPYSTP